MKLSLVARTIRRTVLAHISIAGPALGGCGGRALPNPASDGGPSDGATSVDARAAPCSVTAATPIELGGSSCGPQAIFSFNGSQSACAVDDAGTLPCALLCPLEPGGDAAALTGICGIDESQSTLQCYYGTGCATGRRPEGLRRIAATRSAAPSGPSPTANFLAEVAYLEAASVEAFLRLARELGQFGAPRRLRAAALRAARDEVRHARVTKGLAERAGGRVPVARVRKGRVRSLEAVAIENAVEGCVRETFGAAVALVQSVNARDGKIRAAMRRIAEDEMRHAELSWAVAGWLETRLEPAAQERVAKARASAGRGLAGARAVDPERELGEAMGLPTSRQARAIARDLCAVLWT